MNSIQKCYYCGGENDSSKAAEGKLQCQYCRRWLSIPSKLDQEKQTLYDLGRQKMALLQFEAAEKDFEALIQKDPTNADACWQALLCHYGVEYILDEASHQDVPTISLLHKDPILEHPYYLQALQNAGSEELRATWQAEAEHINSILLLYEKIAAQQEDYDVFISVKQDTPQGTPTSDSFEAAKLMQFLQEKGLRVFNSRFSLKDIIGQEYEPYIMAALLSVRAMVVVGSSRDYLEAKWVRNEWRRFRWLQENSPEKRILIPFLLGMNPSDVPGEMGVIQCVTNTSTSPYADILRAIRKTIPLKIAQLRRPVVVPAGLADEEKESWLEKVRSDLTELEELRDSIMPDLATARDAMGYGEIIIDNLKKLDGFAETDSLSRQAAGLWRHFRAEYERLRLGECVGQVEEIAGRMAGRSYGYAEACALQDELSKIQKELYGYAEQTQTQSVLKKISGLLEENRKAMLRLDPENIITDPLRHALASGKGFLAGLRKDGTVLVTGKEKALVAEAERWTDIISLAAGSRHLVGLRRDGTVVAVGNNKKKQCNVSGWRRIISIAACGDHTLGLDSEGKCCGVGSNALGQLNVSDWQEIVSLSTAERFTIAADRSGRVYTAGDPKLRAASINGWAEVDRVFALNGKAAGIRADGDVLLMGNRPKEEKAQARNINKKKTIIRSLAPAQGNSFAALTGTGEVRLIWGSSLRLIHLILFLLSILVFIIYSWALNDSYGGYYGSYYSYSYSYMLPLKILQVISGLLILAVPVRIILLQVAKTKLTMGLRQWGNVAEIASLHQGKSVVGLNRDGNVLTVGVVSPQWYGIGLPGLDE